ncbi:MAG: hypothetical protein Q9214_003818, partial [Letrouitia sp. 1 TL-2023]
MLARTWSASEATALWVELVASRKKEIEQDLDPSQVQYIAGRIALQQEISRSELARWDASARAWLQSADEVKILERTQLRLITKDCGLLVSSLGNTYASVIDVWTVALKSLQSLISGMPQRISKGAVLLGLSSWHIYPDLNVVGPIAYVPFHDPLVASGGAITLGLQRGLPDNDEGVHWSLSLSHLRYYGSAVDVSTFTKSSNLRITMKQLHYVALGSLFSCWGDWVSTTAEGVEIFVTLESFLYGDSGRTLEKELPWLYNVWMAADSFSKLPQGVEKEEIIQLIGYGRRKGQGFLKDPKVTLRPAFGLAEPRVITSCLRESLPGQKFDEERMITILRQLAKGCKLEPKDTIICYRHLDHNLHHTWEFATAIPYSITSLKRAHDDTKQERLIHARWRLCNIVTKENSLSPYSNIALDDAPNYAPEEQTTTSLIAGNEVAGLFSVQNNLPKLFLRCSEVVKLLRSGSACQSKVKDYLKGIFHIKLKDFCLPALERVEQRYLQQSLTVLRQATSVYEELINATVSIAVLQQPLYKAKWAEFLRKPIWRSSDHFACLAMFESGSLNLDPSGLSEVMAMSSGNSIYVSTTLLQDPMVPSGNTRTDRPKIKRILGNLGRPGITMLAPTEAPLIRPDDINSWKLVNHTPFTEKLEDCFASTSVHLEFTEYEVPLYTPIGAMDAQVTMLETLIRAYERGKWVADLDIVKSMQKESLFRRFPAPRCVHNDHDPAVQKQTAAAQVGKASNKRLISIDNWEELLDPPEQLGIATIGVVRACNSWHARLAAMSISVQKGHRTVV